MKTEINTNDLKQTLESFFTDAIWIQTPKLQSFCRDMFKRHVADIVEVDWCGSGGGNYHLLFRLNSGHIIAMHTDSNICETSYDTWKSITEYFLKSDLESRGFAWEHHSPNYLDRCQSMI